MNDGDNVAGDIQSPGLSGTHRKENVGISGDVQLRYGGSRFLKLNSEHIRFVVGGLKENTTRIRNMRQYLLATLYNAPLTIGNYYRSLVSHDMSEGFI